ncbi:hypothetical protein M885DRAFT_506074 [Pelagophyceae sp. CCMP2097]|nr:hypothetical protein M885DRAFT_506074 [Pelagophyceae sp. CCMP2097]
MAYLMAHPCWCLKPACKVLPAGFPLDTVAKKLWHREGQPRSTAQAARRPQLLHRGASFDERAAAAAAARRCPRREHPAAGKRILASRVRGFPFGGGSLRDACRGRAGRGRAVTKRAPKISVERGHRAYATRVVDEQGVDEQSQIRSHRDRTVSKGKERRAPSKRT